MTHGAVVSLQTSGAGGGAGIAGGCGGAAGAGAASAIKFAFELFLDRLNMLLFDKLNEFNRVF